MLNFSKNTSTAILASNLASAFTCTSTSTKKRAGIANHVSLQTKPFIAAFNKALNDQIKFRNQIEENRIVK